MKIYLRKLIAPILFMGLLASGTAGYGQCYRVYIKMTADFSFFQHYGSVDAAKAAMRNMLTADVLAVYQNLGVEFVLLPMVVYTNLNSDPFRTVQGTQQIANPILVSQFPATRGGAYGPSPTGAQHGFSYDMNILCIYKPMSDQFGSPILGAVVDIGNLYTSQAHLWLTHGQNNPVWITVETPTGPVTIQDGVVFGNAQQSQIVRTFAHEIGHMLGARHDNETVPSPCGQTGPLLMCVSGQGAPFPTFSTTSRNAINNLLTTKHFDSSTGAMDFVSSQNWSAPRAYNVVGQLGFTGGNYISKNGPVFMKSATRIKISGTVSLYAQSNDAIALIVDPTIYDCAAKSSGSNLRTAEGNEELIDIVEMDSPVEEPEGSFYVAPNPFTGVTSVRFSLKKQENVNILIHNALGQRVKSVVSRIFPSGQHEVAVDLTDHKQGLYFIEFSSDSQSKRVRALLQ